MILITRMEHKKICEPIKNELKGTGKVNNWYLKIFFRFLNFLQKNIPTVPSQVAKSQYRYGSLFHRFKYQTYYNFYTPFTSMRS